MSDVVIDGGSPDAVADVVYDGGDPSSTPDVVIDGGSPTPYVPVPPLPPIATPADQRQLWLESLDGSLVIPLNVDVDRILTAGVTGLQFPPEDTVTGTTPGMPGSWLQEVNILEREVFLPLVFASDQSQDDFLAKLKQLRGLIGVWNGVDAGSRGTFNLVASSSQGERILTVVYKDSWTGAFGGADSGARWEKFGLTLLAVDPYFYARDYVTRTYTATVGEPFLSDDDAYPWPRSISESVVIGDDMPVVVEGEVPVWVEALVHGPTGEVDFSFTGTSVQVPDGVLSGSELVLITDPRNRSARLDGAVAWSRISRGSTIAPLQPGTNLVSVQVGTSGEGTGLTLRWKPGWPTAW